jgi:hypothetical protein
MLFVALYMVVLYFQARLADHFRASGPPKAVRRAVPLPLSRPLLPLSRSRKHPPARRARQRLRARRGPQASSFHTTEVVSTLKRALLEDPATNEFAFPSGDQVLAYLGNHVLQPIWTDPVCGDGRCEPPWEFLAWGPFGCRADCGRQPNVSRVILAVSGNFLRHASLSPRTLMAAVRWNLCLRDEARRRRGEADLCW